jgi:hypothetical protein
MYFSYFLFQNESEFFLDQEEKKHTLGVSICFVKRETFDTPFYVLFFVNNIFTNENTRK